MIEPVEAQLMVAVDNPRLSPARLYEYAGMLAGYAKRALQRCQQHPDFASLNPKLHDQIANGIEEFDDLSNQFRFQ